MTTKREVIALWRGLVGRKIVGVHVKPFVMDTPGVKRADDWTADPVLELDDGTQCHFVVDETNVGDYGFHVSRYKRTDPMGYNTRYSLSWKPGPGWAGMSCGHENLPSAKFCQECGASVDGTKQLNRKVADYIRDNKGDVAYAVALDGSCAESCKWYEHAQDMKVMSAAFPNVIFTLKGDGEDSGDQWVGYAWNGKWQTHRAVITYPEIDARAWEK